MLWPAKKLGCGIAGARGCDKVVGSVEQDGPVAQLGVRFHGMEEVVSSNLTRSTKTFPAGWEITACSGPCASSAHGNGDHFAGTRRPARPPYTWLDIPGDPLTFPGTEPYWPHLPGMRTPMRTSPAEGFG